MEMVNSKGKSKDASVSIYNATLVRARSLRPRLRLKMKKTFAKKLQNILASRTHVEDKSVVTCKISK